MTHPINGISINFEIWSKFGVLCFKYAETITTKFYSCHDSYICRILLCSSAYPPGGPIQYYLRQDSVFQWSYQSCTEPSVWSKGWLDIPLLPQQAYGACSWQRHQNGSDIDMQCLALLYGCQSCLWPAVVPYDIYHQKIKIKTKQNKKTVTLWEKTERVRCLDQSE